jgi:hypothetical protein
LDFYQNILTGWSVNIFQTGEGGRRMKKGKGLKLYLAIVIALSLLVTASAQNNLEQKVTFYLDGRVGSEMVKKGTYTILIPETEDGKLEIKMGKKSVTAQFTKRENTTQADADKMTYRDNPDGSRTIATITPRGRKFTLVLDNGSMARQ